MTDNRDLKYKFIKSDMMLIKKKSNKNFMLLLLI